MKIDNAKLQQVLRDKTEIRRLHSARRAMLKSASVTPAEKNMADWLGQLKLMHGVPFYYLVPNVDMLPTESIRFFYCNTIWLDYLQEGALSIGRSTSSFKTHDESFAQRLKTLGFNGARTQRPKVYGHLLNHTHENLRKQLKSASPVTDDEQVPDEKVTGFLLRSGVVKGWKGLQVDAFSDEAQTQPSFLLRMDHLSDDVLLCLFDGEVMSVRIHEEPEVLHFGVDDNGGKFKKSFRNAAGSVVALEPLAIGDFQRNDMKVLNINDLATQMGDKVKPFGFDGFTSAEFALEMVEGVEAVNFKIQL
jgi:hypothetical protein